MPHTVLTACVTDSRTDASSAAIAQHDRTAEYRQNALDRHGVSPQLPFETTLTSLSRLRLSLPLVWRVLTA